MTNSKVAAILNEIALFLELIGENPFKSRAYTNAARVIEGEPEDVEKLVDSGKLAGLPGFGEALTEKVTMLVRTGRLPYYEDLRKKVPKGLLQMIRVPGLGPKRARLLHQKLKIDSIEKLAAACKDRQIENLEGFGEKMEKKILEGIEHLKKYSERHLYHEALAAAHLVMEALKKNKSVGDMELGGSLRRRRETIGDVDLLVSSGKPDAVMQCFTSLPEVATILAEGETKSSVTLKESGIQVDLRVVSQSEYPYALNYFTGSKEHNTLLRARAREMGLKLNEYGLFCGEKNIPCRNEEDIYRHLKLDYIPPELREAMGEIEAAEKRDLPRLVEEKDIRGIFHVHSTWSDGTASLEAMIREAEGLGLDYIGISDHSQSAYYANGLKPDRVREQEKEIAALRKKFRIRIFWGIESDILPDGSLDYEEKILERFDFVIASVHASFTMPEDQMTGRITKALRNKHTTMLGHATGRLLLSREPYPIDMKKVIEVAAGEGKIIELNASPHRFDLDWHWGPYARKKGLKAAINPDAHEVATIADYRYGVGIARKSWFTRQDIINTMPVSKMEGALGLN